jgi:hypothetical protein
MALSAALYANQQGAVGIVSLPRVVEVYVTITASGNYPALGDTLDLTALTGAAGQVGVPAETLPIIAEIVSANSSGVSGYVYAYRPGTTQANGKMQVLVQGAAAGDPLADLGAMAYPAGVTGDTIVGRFVFPRG